MKTNEILDEIHRVREEIVREGDYDVHKLFERMRPRTQKLRAEGRQVVCPALRESEGAAVLREEPPKPKTASNGSQP